ncbi:MAG: lipopolysaccharide core heptose(I) kinase RfaP [Gammaproteobacteria bacterium]|nr:lipopolysaccharide core heptose(I) kinase RfaP [Gammaproteobacteria bacterium]MDD9897206.1 lipopolysaccharide core heptose(I) kinase RfaP [Gammaproteobacteria bacterium]MDD9959147.1 lipopolysaccharide core heptose(I) kinase RfaP [Gammaproteobacteria bacterium]
MFYLNEEIADNFQGEDPFKFLQSMEGKVYRQVKARKTFQFSLNGKSYFAKLHSGVGWLEIIKNLMSFRLPIIGARNEWEAIHRLQELDIASMNAVAYGERGWNPANRESFIVTEELLNTISLEEFCKQWERTPPDPVIKRKLIEKVAHIARVIHRNGICHRDFYLCHFLLHQGEDPFPKLSVIDLHRALVRNNLAQRWVVKDVAGLYYSAKTVGLTQRDLFRFMRHYHDLGLRTVLTKRKSFWLEVEQRAEKMFTKLGPAN